MVMRKPALLLRRLFHDKRGLSAVTVAVSMPVLFGVAGLGVDTGLWYAMKRQNQSAADAAALSAAYEVMAGNTNVATNLTPAATEAATRNNYAGTTPVVTCPYSDAIVANGVRVTLSQTQNAWFSSWFPAFPTFAIANAAVAAVNTLGPSCLTALSPTGASGSPRGADVSTVGSSVINVPNCIITSFANTSNSVYLQGGNNSSITAQTIVTAGQVATTGNPVLTLSNPAQIGAPPQSLTNPYACASPSPPCITHAFLTTGPPAIPATCVANNPPPKGQTTTYPANSRFCNGLNFPNGNATTVDLSPGTYWITDGDLNITSNGTLTCSLCNGTNLGVTIIFTTMNGAAGTIGTVVMNANAQLGGLNAPNAGTFAGLLFVQDTVAGATYSQNGTLQGGPNIAFVATGLIYFPHTDLAFQGNPTLGMNGCLIVYANTVALQGNSNLSATGCTAAGLGGLPKIQTVYLAE